MCSPVLLISTDSKDFNFNKQTEDISPSAFGQPGPSSIIIVNRAATPTSTSTTPTSTPSDDDSVRIDDPSAQVSGFPTVIDAQISFDDLHRIVPGRGQGHTPHGIPDFLVLKQQTREVLLIVKDRRRQVTR